MQTLSQGLSSDLQQPLFSFQRCIGNPVLSNNFLYLMQKIKALKNYSLVSLK